ncbi:MAG: 6-phosphogluconolactonase [Alphaproteobacteria bacterium]
MIIDLSDSPGELGQKAARQGAAEIRQAIAERGEARIILATGASQFDVIEALVAEPDIAWSKVTAFHLDEYLDLPEAHKASFRGYLKTRFVAKIDNLGQFFFIEGDAADTGAEIGRVSEAILRSGIDVAFIGIGENGHLAFNDPPADFDTKEPFIVVEMDEKCRLQQANEGWFSDISEVPSRAISMSIQ